jgi:hypothetical protein
MLLLLMLMLVHLLLLLLQYCWGLSLLVALLALPAKGCACSWPHCYQQQCPSWLVFAAAAGLLPMGYPACRLQA